MDFSMWIQSPTDWGMLFLSAMLIGMSKTGIQGISLLAVPLGSVVLPPHCGAIYQIIPIVVTTDDGNVQHQQFTGVHLSPCTPFSEPRYSTQPHKKTEAY